MLMPSASLYAAAGKLSSRNLPARQFTLHIAFPLVYYKGVAFALALQVLDHSYSLDCAVHLKLVSQIRLCDFFGLHDQQSVCLSARGSCTHQSREE